MVYGVNGAVNRHIRLSVWCQAKLPSTNLCLNTLCLFANGTRVVSDSVRIQYSICLFGINKMTYQLLIRQNINFYNYPTYIHGIPTVTFTTSVQSMAVVKVTFFIRTGVF